jgi:hypothetical protein
MFKIDSLSKTALAIVGTIILTTTTVGAAIGPARAVETAPVAYAQAAGTVAHV